MNPLQTILTMVFIIFFSMWLYWPCEVNEPEDIEPDLTPYDEEEWR